MCAASSVAREILLTDHQCVEFLQWALPQLGLRWPGFRKVRGQVHKRIVRRLRDLELTHIAEYRRHLADNPAEWTVLDACLRISISRFYRDCDVFDHLSDSVLPDLARAAQRRGENRLRVWSAGCASGEEPYTVALTWINHVRPNFPDLTLDVLATDADETMLQRAARASYPASSIKGVPADWKQSAFVCSNGEYQLDSQVRSLVLIGLIGICTGGHARVRGPVIEFYGGGVKWLLHRFPHGQFTLAFTLGPTVLGQTDAALDICRDHELVHVRRPLACCSASDSPPKGTIRISLDRNERCGAWGKQHGQFLPPYLDQ
jgi:hypothetical protein